jgi:hypothetical protein
MIRITVLFLLLVTPAMADVCKSANNPDGIAALRDFKSYGTVKMAVAAPIPADVKPFVEKTDSNFQDQEMTLYPLGKSGAGLAVHFEGTLATQYLVTFDRAGGKLKSVPTPNLNTSNDDYFEAHLALVAGTPALFANDGENITMTPWTGHAWGAICSFAEK